MIGVIADDLTGAAEIGAVGWRFGLRADVLLSGEPDGDFDLVCIDTDSRSCTSEEAGRRAANAAAKLRKAGAKWIYKKVDSVLRGNVIVELEAIMREIGVDRALLAPANPSLGRTIRDETYFVHGQPIHETEFAHDPEHPRKSSRVLELLSTPKTFSVRVSRPGLVTSTPGIVVAEVTSVADLRLWARRRADDILQAGGAEFFGALLAATGYASGTRRKPMPSAERELFICGSTSESSREFVRAARERGTPAFSLPKELADGGAFSSTSPERMIREATQSLRSHSRVILSVGLPLIRERSLASRLKEYLVQVAATVLRESQVDHVYVEGGATAAALFKEMKLERLEVIEEVALGVATLAGHRGRSTKFTIKPGSYVWPTEIRDG